jgi:hypothetical protein
LAASNFHVPLCGSAKHAPALKKQTAKISPKVFVLIAPMKPGFGFRVNTFPMAQRDY